MTVMLLNQCPMMVATTETDHPYPPSDDSQILFIDAPLPDSQHPRV